jgi:hypothetical protein
MTRQRPRRSQQNPDQDGVGYGKPPKKHQFKKGRSGNPKGRPKRSKNANKLVYDILNEKRVFTDSGVSKTAPTREIAMRMLAEKALKGDQRALDRLIEMDGAYQAQKVEQSAAAQQSNGNTLEADQVILARYLNAQQERSDDTE